MFSITKVWTEEKIRFIIHKLDEKTGLSGADLPIAFKAYGNTLGNYQYVEPVSYTHLDVYKRQAHPRWLSASMKLTR